MNDPNMDTALQWADQFGPPCQLTLSLLSVDQRAILVNLINNNLVRSDLLNMLSIEEKERRLREVADASKEFLPDLVDESGAVKSASVYGKPSGCQFSSVDRNALLNGNQ